MRDIGTKNYLCPKDAGHGRQGAFFYKISSFHVFVAFRSDLNLDTRLLINKKYFYNQKMAMLGTHKK
jgi:hypothetical protein